MTDPSPLSGVWLLNWDDGCALSAVTDARKRQVPNCASRRVHFISASFGVKRERVHTGCTRSTQLLKLLLAAARIDQRVSLGHRVARCIAYAFAARCERSALAGALDFVARFARGGFNAAIEFGDVGIAT